MNTDIILNRDAELFDKFLESLEPDEREYWRRVVVRLGDAIRSRHANQFGDKSAKHLLVQMCRFLENPERYGGVRAYREAGGKSCR